MPPRKKATTPAAQIPSTRVLRTAEKTSVPLRQVKFPSPKKRIHTYGTKPSRAVPRWHKQDTLTQIWPHLGEVEETVLLPEDTSGKDEGAMAEAGPNTSRQKKTLGDEVHCVAEYDEGSEKRRKRQRRVTSPTEGTFGVSMENNKQKQKKGRRKTLGDMSASESQATLTQLDFPNYAKRPDEETSKPKSIYDIPSSSQENTRVLRRRSAPLNAQRSTSSAAQAGLKVMMPPQTPRSRKFPTEIPSSNSPTTPLTPRAWSRISASPYVSPSFKRTPLSRKSINTPSVPLSVTPKSSTLPTYPKLEVRDTFASTTDESQLSHAEITTPKRATPLKTVRFASLVTFSPAANRRQDVLTRRRDSTPRPKVIKEEISDSEDDDDHLDYSMYTDVSAPVLNEIKDDLPIHLETEPRNHTNLLSRNEASQRNRISAILDKPIRDLSEDSDPNTITEDEVVLVEEIGLSGGQKQASREVAPETYYGGSIGAETQLELDLVLKTTVDSQDTFAEADVSTSDSQYLGEPTQNKSYMSQRISTQHVNSMDPRTPESDAFICVSPSHMQQLINRKKAYEIRKYALLPNTVRVWFYETGPKSRLKYMAEIGSAEHPQEPLVMGTVTKVNSNENFSDDGDFAYKILSLYELADPVPFADIKERGWFKAPPIRYTCVRPAPLDELMANLQPPLFRTYHEEIIESSSTDTQEVIDQLADNIKQFTQATHEPPTIPSSADAELTADAPPQDEPHRDESSDLSIVHESEIEDEDDLELPLLPPRTPTHPRPSQAETVDLTQAETPLHRSPPHTIWESPTRSVVVPGTPELPELPMIHTRKTQRSSSVVPFSLASSQLLSRSQMLPESLTHDSVPAPPLFMSEDDNDDDL